MTSSSYIKKIFFALALLGYVGMTLFSVVHIIHMAKMNMPMENCPFTLGEHSLCKMDTVAHIKAWQQFSTTLPFVGVILFVFLFVHHALPTLRPLLYRRRKWLYIISLYQQLFSQGLLNPKAP